MALISRSKRACSDPIVLGGRWRLRLAVASFVVEVATVEGFFQFFFQLTQRVGFNKSKIQLGKTEGMGAVGAEQNEGGGGGSGH